MNALTRIRLVSRFPRIYRTFASHKEEEESPWYRDNAPGPYPKTEEEKCAAAKKYGLLREEYEPYPDDGDGFGDYPKIENINVESKDPFYPWTDGQYRRNHNETISPEFLAYLPGRASSDRRKHSDLYYVLGFLAFPTALGLLIYFFKDYKVHMNQMEKQLYKPGVTYYTFDFEDTASSKHH